MKDNVKFVEELAELKANLGQMYLTLEDFKKALKCYSNASQLAPGKGEYLAGRAEAKAGLGWHKDAAEDAWAAVNIDGRSVRAWLRLAASSLAIGDIDWAEAAAYRVRILDPNNTRLPELMDKINAAKDAIMDRVRVVEPDSDESEIKQEEVVSEESCIRGTLLYYSGRFEDAIPYLREDGGASGVLRGMALAVRGLTRAARSLLREGMPEEALRLYAKALEIDPANRSLAARLLVERASVWQSIGRTHQAAADSAQAFDFDPESAAHLLAANSNLGSDFVSGSPEYNNLR